MRPAKQGCITNAQLNLLVAILSLVITALVGRNELSPIIDEISKGSVSIWSGIISWLSTPISISLGIFLLSITTFMAISLRFLFTRLYARLQKKRYWVSFRDMWLLVELGSNNIPQVVNRDIYDAKCGHGDCMQSIIGADSQSGWVSYLKCKDGHYVGSDIKHDHKQLVEPITEDSQQIESAAPAFSGYFIPNRLTDNQIPPRNEQEFYSRLIRDYESEQVRHTLRTSLHKSSIQAK